jgi:pimeloyl-ACP methyl ester carboxylesterase
MPSAHANGIQIEYDTFGDPKASPLLLVMGLGAQMIGWPEEFAQLIADAGHFVVRYDNRDVGLSSKIESAGVPDIAKIMADREAGAEVTFAYTLKDMAADGIGLMDALGIERAHVVGASMGGMIVQQMAIDHPARLLSMTSIMSSTGAPDLPQATEAAMAMLLTPAPADRDAYIEHRVRSARVIGSASHLIDEARIRRTAVRLHERAFYPVGTARQMAAIMASGSRREALRAVSTPTLVIHGAIDPLVPVEGGIDTANAVAGARLLVLDDMGHDLPEALWPQIVDAITRHTAKAG